MSRHIHQKGRGSRKCIVCDSPTCPAVGGSLLNCDERIPRLLEHGVRWLIIDRMVDFSSFSKQFGYGGSFQINSGDVSEGLAAIVSGRRAMGRGGHGPGARRWARARCCVLGNVHSAHDSRDVLEPILAGYQRTGVRRLRGRCCCLRCLAGCPVHDAER